MTKRICTAFDKMNVYSETSETNEAHIVEVFDLTDGFKYHLTHPVFNYQSQPFSNDDYCLDSMFKIAWHKMDEKIKKLNA